MSQNAIKSTGTIIRYRTSGTSDPYVAIAECKDIDGVGEKTTFLDATSQDDTAEAVVPSGITHYDELTSSVNFIPDDPTHDAVTGLRAMQRAKTKLDIEEEYPDGTIDSYQAYVGMCKVKAPVEGILTCDFSLRLTSEVTTT